MKAGDDEFSCWPTCRASSRALRRRGPGRPFPGPYGALRLPPPPGRRHRRGRRRLAHHPRRAFVIRPRPRRESRDRLPEQVRRLADEARVAERMQSGPRPRPAGPSTPSPASPVPASSPCCARRQRSSAQARACPRAPRPWPSRHERAPRGEPPDRQGGLGPARRRERRDPHEPARHPRRRPFVTSPPRPGGHRRHLRRHRPGPPPARACRAASLRLEEKQSRPPPRP